MKTKSIKKYRSVGEKSIKIVSSKKKASSKKRKSKRSKLTVKRTDKSLEKGCEETMCTKYVKEDLEFAEAFTGEIIKNLKKMSLEDPDLEKREIAKKSMKNFLIAKKEQSSPSYLKREMRICKKMYCNQSCEGTVVYDIVKDGFNKKLHPKEVKELKRDGATSGCIHAF